MKNFVHNTGFISHYLQMETINKDSDQDLFQFLEDELKLFEKTCEEFNGIFYLLSNKYTSHGYKYFSFQKLNRRKRSKSLRQN